MLGSRAAKHGPPTWSDIAEAWNLADPNESIKDLAERLSIGRNLLQAALSEARARGLAVRPTKRSRVSAHVFLEGGGEEGTDRS